MNIEQIYDEGLAQAAYAIESEGQVALIDPGRDPQPYLDFARKHQARIVAVLETHPHADFASSHLEFARKHGAKIYINPKAGVSYNFEPLEDGDTVRLGKVTFKTLFTPGHSPDHNTYLLLDETGKPHAVFTGDALFVGDVGRPDLREGAGSINMKKEELAGHMFDTVQQVFKPLPDEVRVYPAHGAGSACGKQMDSNETFSTIGKERTRNWALQENDKHRFVRELLEGQVHVPQYFPYEVEQNRKGFAPMTESIGQVKILNELDELDGQIQVVDTRPAAVYKQGHLQGAWNIPDGSKFEHWLGTLIAPETPFYLLAGSQENLDQVIRKTAKIGYERFVRGGLVVTNSLPVQSHYADQDTLRQDPEQFTIVDVRREDEAAQEKIFEYSLNIPLQELQERAEEVPVDKPVAVHCAGGYRSAMASSILEQRLGQQATVVDVGEAIREFQQK